MNKLLSGLLGALAFCAVAVPGQAAPVATAAPASIAVFHPGEAPASVETVQYYGRGRPDFGYRRPHFRRGFYRHRFFGHSRLFGHRGRPYGVPFRRY